MKASDFLDDDDRYNVGQDDDDILFEMSNFRSNDTGLPSNIEIWVRSDPITHQHNRYRIKVLKDKQWAAIFTVGSNPVVVKNINQSLLLSEHRLITNWIKTYSSLIIGLIDSKYSTGEFTQELHKLRNMD